MGRVLSPLIWVITTVILLITLHITTHEPPNKAALRFQEALKTGVRAAEDAPAQPNSLVLSKEWGNGFWGLYWGLYRDYYRDPFPHSLLSTREKLLRHGQTILNSDCKLPKVDSTDCIHPTPPTRNVPWPFAIKLKHKSSKQREHVKTGSWRC